MIFAGTNINLCSATVHHMSSYIVHVIVHLIVYLLISVIFELTLPCVDPDIIIIIIVSIQDTSYNIPLSLRVGCLGGCGSGRRNVLSINDNTSSSSPPSWLSRSFPDEGRLSISPSPNPLFLLASCFDLLLFSLADDSSGVDYYY